MLAIEEYIFKFEEEILSKMTEEEKNMSFEETMEMIRRKKEEKKEEKKADLRLKESQGRIW